MANLNLKLKTWSCDTCGYVQDFEPTPEAMKWHFVDSEPLSSQGKQWRIYAQHDWSKPTCPACLVTAVKASDLANKKLITAGKQPKAFDVSSVPELTPEFRPEKKSIQTLPSDAELATAVFVLDPDDSQSEPQTFSAEEADAEDIVRADQGRSPLQRSPLTKEERTAYADRIKVGVQDMVDRNMLDETDLPTKKIRMNLALGKLSDV